MIYQPEVLKTVRSPKGYLIVPVHYRHDPDKDLAWELRERQKYTIEADWNREQEFDTREVRGTPAYPGFNYRQHVSEDVELVPELPICLAMDFNVAPMVFEVCQIHNNTLYVIDEIVLDPASIPRMMEEFKNRYPSHGADLFIYGDATGNARSPQSNQSHYDLVTLGLRSYPAPLVWKVPLQNPPIKDRLDAMNSKLKNSDGLIGVYIHPRCKMLTDDFSEVVLEKGGKSIHKVYRTEDPYAKRTHACLHGKTWIETPNGPRHIETLSIGDKVRLPSGDRKITVFSERWAKTWVITLENGVFIHATAKHKFLTERGLVTTDALRYNDVLLTKEHPLCKRAITMMENDSTLGLRDAITGLAMDVTKQENDEHRSISIGLYGKKKMAQYRKGIISIIKTVIHSIMRWKISNALKRLCICQNIASNQNGQSQERPHRSLKNTDTKPLSGIEAVAGVIGTENMEDSPGVLGSLGSTAVLNAINTSNQKKSGASIIVQITAVQPQGEHPGWIMKHVAALFARKISPSTNTKKAGRVILNVEQSSLFSTVYDMTIEDDHCYIANGVLTSNSDALSYLVFREWPVFRELQEAKKRRNHNAPRGRRYQRIIGAV